MDIKIVKNTNPKAKPDQSKLGFGKYMTDHMFIMDYDAGEGWHDARIVPYGPIEMEPNAIALHYAQETFEGLKAYRTADGHIQLFRPEMNEKRMINSNARLCMPAVPVEMFIEAIETLVKVDADWIPTAPETSLYIRPFMFANQGQLGVHASHKYIFAIILPPVGAYYENGLAPVCKFSKWGYINTKGEEVIKCQFREAGEFTNGIAPVIMRDKSCAYIDENGEIVMQFGNFTKLGSFRNGLAWFADKNDKVGYINEKGEIVIEPQFELYLNVIREDIYTQERFYAGGNFYDDGYAIVETSDHKQGVIDKQDNFIIEPIYDSIN